MQDSSDRHHMPESIQDMMQLEEIRRQNDHQNYASPQALAKLRQENKMNSMQLAVEKLKDNRKRLKPTPPIVHVLGNMFKGQ
jgi:hypothetical protein